MTDKVSVFENDLASLQFRLPERTDEGNKGSFGRCAIVGGCANFVGAPRFAAESASEVLALLGETAMRSGAGTTVLAVPDFLATALYPVVRYSAVFPLPSRDGHIVFERERAAELAKKATSFAVGMGMGDGDAESWVRFVLDDTECRVVLDADGLKCAGKIADYKGRAVLTPHVGEFAAMTGMPASEIKADAVRLAREYAAEHNCVIIVKSQRRAGSVDQPHGQRQALKGRQRRRVGGDRRRAARMGCAPAACGKDGRIRARKERGTQRHKRRRALARRHHVRHASRFRRIAGRHAPMNKKTEFM